jgi:hypothetical protein
MAGDGAFRWYDMHYWGRDVTVPVSSGDDQPLVTEERIGDPATQGTSEPRWDSSGLAWPVEASRLRGLSTAPGGGHAAPH